MRNVTYFSDESDSQRTSQTCGKGRGTGRRRGNGRGRGRGGRGRSRGRGRGRGGRGTRQHTAATTGETNDSEQHKWTIITNRQNDKSADTLQFDEETGISTTLTPQSSLVDFFNLFIDEIVLTMLVDGTNSYADMTIQSKGVLSPQSRWRNWTPVTDQEMKAVLAIITTVQLETRNLLQSRPIVATPTVLL